MGNSLQKKQIYGSNELCKVYEVTDAQKKKYIYKAFKKSQLQKYKLQQTLSLNEQVFYNKQQGQFSKHLLKIYNSFETQNQIVHKKQYYDIRLDQYLKHGLLHQRQVLQIFDHILKIYYNLTQNGYLKGNLRPQHFVRSQNLWKLQSLVNTEQKILIQEFDSQYSYNQGYQAHQTYERQIDDQQIKPVLVWNLGALLLYLFLGRNIFEKKNIINRFKNDRFSLEKVDLSNAVQCSSQIKQLLSHMLHYNSKQRLSLRQVYKNSFLSQQVSQLMKIKYPQKPQFFVFQQNKQQYDYSEQISQYKQNQQKQNQFFNTKQYINDNNRKQVQNKKQNQIQNKKQNQIQNKQIKQQQPIKPIKKQQKLIKKKQSDYQLLQRIKQINMDKIKQIRKNQIETRIQDVNLQKNIQLYQSNWDKCEIINKVYDKLNILSYKDSHLECLYLCQYALKFVSSMYANNLVMAMNQNANVMQIQQAVSKQFFLHQQYKILKKMYNYRIKNNSDSLNSLKNRILLMNKRTLSQKDDILQFLMKNYKQSNFTDIKDTYRKILKQIYDIVTQKYRANHQQQLARLVTYIVYCMTIDKLYTKQHILNNFQAYFKYSFKQPTFYISANQFQKYVDNAPIQILMFNSNKILDKYFKI